MKKKIDIYLICMTLVKFIFYSMVCWLALYAAYQYSETSLTLKIILGCGIAIILMNVIAYIFNYEPRLYFLIYSYGNLPTIAFFGYSIVLMLKFEENISYIYLIGVYLVGLLGFVLTAQDLRAKNKNLRSRVISIYNANKDNNLIGDKVIKVYKDNNKSRGRTSKIEKLTPFIPVFNLLFVKHYSSVLGLLYITCLMFLLSTMIVEFGRNAYNFVHLFSTLRKMEK